MAVIQNELPLLCNTCIWDQINYFIIIIITPTYPYPLCRFKIECKEKANWRNIHFQFEEHVFSVRFRLPQKFPQGIVGNKSKEKHLKGFSRFCGALNWTWLDFTWFAAFEAYSNDRKANDRKANDQKANYQKANDQKANDQNANDQKANDRKANVLKANDQKANDWKANYQKANYCKSFSENANDQK